jgi:hypothetical protein
VRIENLRNCDRESENDGAKRLPQVFNFQFLWQSLLLILAIMNQHQKSVNQEMKDAEKSMIFITPD